MAWQFDKKKVVSPEEFDKLPTSLSEAKNSLKAESAVAMPTGDSGAIVVSETGEVVGMQIARTEEAAIVTPIKEPWRDQLIKASQAIEKVRQEMKAYLEEKSCKYLNAGMNLKIRMYSEVIDGLSTARYKLDSATSKIPQ